MKHRKKAVAIGKSRVFDRLFGFLQCESKIEKYSWKTQFKV